MASRLHLAFLLCSSLYIGLITATVCPEGVNPRCQCPSVTTLNCSSSNFEEFPANISLPNITILNLQDNKIKSLPDDAFLEFPHLTTIDLSKNQLQDVGASFTSFANGFPQLKVLELSHNNLNSTDGFDFTSMPQLEQLMLSNNQLTNLGDLGSSVLPSLRLLKLNSNQISSLGKGKLAGLQYVKVLMVNDNNLARIQANTFNGMESLTDLELSKNNISEIEDDAFVGLANLTLLNLSNNKLEMITPTQLTGLYSIEQLYLNDNKIESIKIPQLVQQTLQSIYLTNNNIRCDDDLQWLYNWKDNHVVTGECQTPVQLSAKSLTDVTNNEFAGIFVAEVTTGGFVVNVTLNSTAVPTPPSGGLDAWIIIVIVLIALVLVALVVVCFFKVLNRHTQAKPITTHNQTRIFYNQKYDSVKQSGQRSKDVYADLTTEL